MSFTRARTQVLTRLMPGALFIHDDYGVCQVNAVDLDPTEAVNATALLDAVRDYLSQWDAPLRAGFVVDPTIDPRRVYVIGAPTRVRFTRTLISSSAPGAGGLLPCGA